MVPSGIGIVITVWKPSFWNQSRVARGSLTDIAGMSAGICRWSDTIYLLLCEWGAPGPHPDALLPRVRGAGAGHPAARTSPVEHLFYREECSSRRRASKEAGHYKPISVGAAGGARRVVAGPRHRSS